MMELNSADSIANKTGVRKMKKSTLSIDMTPMVDLGFLLIAFFIFATEITKPATTSLYMPHGSGDSTGIADSKSLTILLGSNDKVFYYYGIDAEAIKGKEIALTSYNEMTGIGNLIRQKQLELEKRRLDRRELFVFIKPGKNSSYKNVVDALDEMIINGVTRYTVIDQGKAESAFLDGQN